MITQDKIKIYTKYGGDIDNWARSGSKKEKLVMNDNDWYLIDSLIQDLTLIKNGLAALSFHSDVNYKLKENCDSEETIQMLKAMTYI
jgi:hypothetical protein